MPGALIRRLGLVTEHKASVVEFNASTQPSPFLEECICRARHYPYELTFRTSSFYRTVTKDLTYVVYCSYTEMSL